ncbi:MAG TPA: hypothetical protein VFR68_09980 [Candidatus Dormibacteraeota bacterium]|nr:hypothetical protein [Candidatus Dormibacteraeota bacterium]
MQLPSVVDIAGPRRDGLLVISGGRRLYLFDRSTGTLLPFANGRGGYPPLPGDEPYLAISTNQPVAGAGCSFAPDDVFVIDQGPHRVWRIDGAGKASVFAEVSGVTTLSGITFDTTGRFGQRLLVMGPAHGLMVVAAIDCRGKVTDITRAAPAVEGGIAVAPSTFGAFAGDLLAPDELSGTIWAIKPNGNAVKVIASGLPNGQDLGVEGLGFAPPGFTGGGAAYFADRATPGNPHPGTGNLLAADATALRATGVRDGDLIVATEGGARTIAVRCSASCIVNNIGAGPDVAHGEGHVLLIANHPLPSPSPLPAGGEPKAAAQAQSLALRIALLALVAAAIIVIWSVVRRRRRMVR